MADDDLHLLPPLPRVPEPLGDGPPCRVGGCAFPARDGLGFCRTCRARYDAATSRRRRLVDLLVRHLIARGDPRFAAFGHRPRVLGAHVLAHLESLDAEQLHVPPAAVRDYIAELDEQARRPA